MGIGVAGFDWDEGNREKCRKHGVSLAEIEEILTGIPLSLRMWRIRTLKTGLSPSAGPERTGRCSWLSRFA